MRLTLRTMLAYLDDILEPDDQAAIASKISESEFASDLSHRIRDLVRRMRLGAPQLTGRGMGLDPNTVAEYLDNTLPPERVADFEKVCLESDVHLAEVAACHQILTLVLGEPAQVEPASRERMYRVPALAKQLREQNQSAGKAAAALGASAQGDGAASNAKAHKRLKPEVPDYLRESQKSGRKRLVALAIAALLLVGAGVYFLAPPQFLAGILGPPPHEPDVPADVVPKKLAPPDVDLGEAEPGDPAGGIALPGEAVDDPEELIKQPQRPPAEPPAAKSDPVLEQPPAVAGKAAPTADKLPPLPAPPTDADDADDLPPFPPEKADGQEKTVQPPPEEPMLEQPEEPAAANGQPVGIYASPMSVLLRFDPKTSAWRQVASGAPLGEGDQLLALPTFRPAITLSSGISLELAGGTSIVLMPSDMGEIPGIEIQYGSIVLTSPAERLLRLKFGEEHRLVGLSAASRLAVQLHRLHVPGADPEQSTAEVDADLYAVTGRFRWDVGGNEAILLAPARWELNGNAAEPGGKAGDFPPWIEGEMVNASDSRASAALLEAFRSNRPTNLIVSELVDNRREEVRSLASRASVHLGRFEPFIVALNDRYQRPAWNAHIESLRTALALGPDVAASIREAFQRKRGEEDGRDLYRMLWGYSADDLKESAAEKLVDYLDHEQLDFRVLAIWNLRTITGLGLYYQPEHSAAQRQKSIRAWRDRLASGDIAPYRPPTTSPPPASSSPLQPPAEEDPDEAEEAPVPLIRQP